MKLRIITAAAIALVVAGCATSPKQGAELMSSNGLIAHYPLDGDATDVSGNGNSGQVVGAAPTTDRSGVEGGALQFNGDGDEIIIERLKGVTRKGFSVSLWAQFDFPGKRTEWRDWVDGGKGFHHPIICQDDMFAIRTIQLCLWRKQILWHRFGPNVSCVRKGEVEAGTWHHIAVVFDGEHHSLYVDGKLAERQPGPLNVAESYRFTIGSVGEDPKNRGFFAGSLDDIRIYNRALPDI